MRRRSRVDQLFDELDDLRHVLGRPGEMVDRVDAQRREIAVVVGDVLLGDLDIEMPRSLAFLISLSSTSVMLTTQVTS